MNGAALMKIGKRMGFSAPPTAVQGRIMGSKGVWLLHPTDRAPDAEPKIWIRPSQMKIHLVRSTSFGPDSLRLLHRAHRIFDFIMPSRSAVPSRLSRLTILNLHHNGVPKDIFVNLMKTGLEAEVEALTRWEGVSAMSLLWHAVNKSSGVSTQRLRRSAAGIQRALGLTRRPDENSDDEDEPPAPSRSSRAVSEWNAADENSETPEEQRHGTGGIDGPPETLAESILERIQAGFSPLKDFYLYEDLRKLVKLVLESYIEGYHIVIPDSADAFIVPGEHFRATNTIKLPVLDLPQS